LSGYINHEMLKVLLLLLVMTCSVAGYSQNGFIVLKKRNKTIQYFAKDSYIIFKLNDGQWLRGIITHITPDSFYLTQEIIRYYSIGTDTIRYKGLSFSLKDISTMPTRKQGFVYDRDQVRVIPGHERFIWLKNGLIFQAAGGGYTGLNAMNDLYYNDPPFENKLLELGIGVGVFLLGQLLHFRFDPFLNIGKKYHLESVVF
jgi:hypothetical protein